MVAGLVGEVGLGLLLGNSLKDFTLQQIETREGMGVGLYDLAATEP